MAWNTHPGRIGLVFGRGEVVGVGQILATCEQRQRQETEGMANRHKTVLYGIVVQTTELQVNFKAGSTLKQSQPPSVCFGGGDGKVSASKEVINSIRATSAQASPETIIAT